MSDDQLKGFLGAVKADTELQEKLKAANDPDEAVAIAKDAGFAISVDDLKQRQEASDAELENLAGGARVTIEITCNCPDTIGGYNCFPTAIDARCPS
jgi:predicted ribosomally synthesized peptide with nif11-like leader